LCDKKTNFKVIILECAEYQLLRFVVGFGVDSMVAGIHGVLEHEQQRQTTKQADQDL